MASAVAITWDVECSYGFVATDSGHGLLLLTVATEGCAEFLYIVAMHCVTTVESGLDAAMG